MPQPPLDSATMGQRRIWFVCWLALAIVLVETVVMVMAVRRIGVVLPVGWQACSFILRLGVPVLAGFAVHAIVMAFRGQASRYLREIAQPRNFGLTLLLFLNLIVVMVFYADLKVMVPLLTERGFDAILWRIDSWLFFGMSPNVFFVNLLDNSTLLRFIDFGYGYFFFFSVIFSFPLVLPLRDDRFRSSFVVANVILWSVGAWLYYSFPSLGPAYRFHEVWDAVRGQFPVSTYWQKQLLDNYRMVLGIAGGRIDPGMSLVEGIGAFPSLHVDFQALFALYLDRLSRVAGRVAWLLVFLTFLGSILTGWHYMVDSIAGLGLAWTIWFLMERVVLPDPLPFEREVPSDQES